MEIALIFTMTTLAWISGYLAGRGIRPRHRAARPQAASSPSKFARHRQAREETQELEMMSLQAGQGRHNRSAGAYPGFSQVDLQNFPPGFDLVDLQDFPPPPEIQTEQ